MIFNIHVKLLVNQDMGFVTEVIVSLTRQSP